jgi:hypothetical protein
VIKRHRRRFVKIVYTKGFLSFGVSVQTTRKVRTETLLVATVPRITSMGFGAAVDAKDFFEIAALVEAAL